MAGPFGIYHGCRGEQRNGHQCFTLVHVPSATPTVSLMRLKDCKELARKLYQLKLRWDATDAAAVTGPGQYEAEWLVRLYAQKHGALGT